MTDIAKLILGDKEYEFPVRIGTEGNRAIDIDGFFERTKHITLDHAFANTGGTTSNICFKEGETGDLGWLWYRGYPVEDVAANCDFLEAAYLLIRGELPNVEQLEEFRRNIHRQSLLHEGMQTIFAGFPPNAHPMAILGSVVGALSILLHRRARRRRSPASRAGDLPPAGQAADHRRLRLQAIDRRAVHFSARAI